MRFASKVRGEAFDRDYLIAVATQQRDVNRLSMGSLGTPIRRIRPAKPEQPTLLTVKEAALLRVLL